MIRWLGVLGLVFFPAAAAMAQTGGSEIVVPPAPPVVPEAPSAPPPAPPAVSPPPGLVPATPPGVDNAAPTAGQPPSAATQPPPPDVAPTPANDWTPKTTAVLGVLNKVDGSTSEMKIPVGGPAQTSGDLSVTVQACLTRPAGDIPDDAVFLTVTPVQQPGTPLYRGWMLRSAPGASFVGNAGQTFRIVSCS